VVYTRFFEGVEVGNPSDGYLTATGDNDTSDPYNGMDGTGPWFQQVGGGFSDGGSYGGGTRFPCTYVFSFWRSSYTLGVGTIPPASTALTENVITVTVSTGAVVFPDGRVFTAADGPVALASVPLVSGGALAADPHTGDGTVSFSLQCQNVETTFSVQAIIRWATQKRQHILYGRVRECYDTPDPEDPTVTSCDTFCSGDPPPDVVYLTISGLSSVTATPPYAGTVSNLAGLNGTYVIEKWLRESGVCNQFLSQYTNPSPCEGILTTFAAAVNISNGFGVSSQPFANTWVSAFWEFDGDCYIIAVSCAPGTVDVCVSQSGTGEIQLFKLPFGDGFYKGSFSWTLSP
jgi:hypothetical protein